MEEDLPPVPEKTVDMDLAAGESILCTASPLLTLADGKTVVAKTPDGTRVPTPAQGSSAPATSSARQGSYASAVKAPAIDWHLEFRLDGHKLSMADTVYGVLHKYGRSSPGVPQSAYNVFNSNVVIMYRKVSGPAPERKSPVRVEYADNHSRTRHSCGIVAGAIIRHFASRLSRGGCAHGQDPPFAECGALP
jgi:hypothetical protein